MTLAARTRAVLCGASLLVGPLASAAEPAALELPEYVDLANQPSAPIAFHGTAAEITFAALHATVQPGKKPAQKERGVLRARLTPSGGKIPRVAIVAALANDGRMLAWGTVPMHGSATVIAHSKPKATVRLQVGDASYGPAVADRFGETPFDVKVPPGVRTARAFAQDLLGATRETDVAIDPPPTGRVLAICEPDGVLTVLVAATGGGPAEAAAVEVRADTGSIAAPQRVAAGHWRASFDGSGAGADQAVLSASLAGEPESVSTCSVAVPPEPPAGLEVTLGVEEFHAGAGTGIPVTVTLRHRGLRTPAYPPPSIEADFGEVNEPNDLGGGRFAATWNLPDAIEGRRAATLRASVGGHAREASVTVRPGPAARIEALLPDSSLRADGRTLLKIAVRVFDAFGNIAAGPLEARAESGWAQGLRNGEGIAVYVPPLRHERGEDVLLLRADATEVALPITLRPVPRTLAMALHGGWTTNLARVSAPRGTVEVSTRPAILGGRLATGIEAGVLPVQTTMRAGGERVDASVSAIPVLLRASLDVWRGPVDVFAGAGAGTMIARTTTSSPSTGRAESVQPFFTGGAFGGAMRRFDRGSAGLEVWWRTARIDTPTLDGDVGGLGAQLFWRWELR